MTVVVQGGTISMSALDDLASAVVQLMATAATAAATSAGSAAASLVGDLVRTRLTGAGQSAAVATFDAAPQEPAAQASLHSALVTVMAADQPFVVQLTSTMPAAEPGPQPAAAAPANVASGGGITIQGTGNKVRGNFAGRDQIINKIRNGDPWALVVLALVIVVLALAGYGGVQLIGGGDSPPTNEKSVTSLPFGTTDGQEGRTNAQSAAPAAASKASELWSIPRNPWAFASPVVSDGKVYYLSYSSSTGIDLLVVDASSGTVRSTLHLDDNEFGVPGALAVSGRNFYLVDHNGVLHAGNDAGMLWKYHTGASNQAPMKAPTVADGMVFVGGWNDVLHAVDAATGTKRWSFTAKDRIVSSPAVSKGVVYAGSRDGHLYALDEATGNPLWAFPSGEAFHDSSPVVADGTVFIGGTKGTFFAVNTADGSERWKFRTEGTDDQISSDPVVSGGLVYFGCSNKIFYALDAATGTKRWSVSTGDFIFSSPALADGVVYFGGWDGKLRAVDAATGTERWTYTSEGQVMENPAIGKDTVFIATRKNRGADGTVSDSGHLYALRR
ncbi:PQQ-binding-like beta-propeller repeat protein [Kitasatospora sp. NPDC048545]|uniref:PQQ-binding-like beta-propeller repeat protein n=1 Tax=Kitasatospora sp. NPDC048545 TaxID=3157208 RepID=UPI00340DE5E8